MGVGPTLSMLAGLTAILRQRAGPGLASSLNAVEFSAMLGVLTGATLLTMLPQSVSWATALLIACVPVLANLALLPALRRHYRHPPADRVRCSRAARPPPPPRAARRGRRRSWPCSR